MKDLKFRQPIYLDGVFNRFHYWGFTRSGEFTGVLPPLDEAQKNSQQYTCLKDKNGTEIYEGDIVGNVSVIFGVHHRGEVYKELSGKWMIRTKRGDHPAYIQDDRSNEEQTISLISRTHKGQHNVAEVIGNIYENKELLK